MAHFAQLDENNLVTNVIVVDNTDVVDSNGDESEAVGIQFCVDLLGGTWKQTSYNARIRKNFASINFTYDLTKDAFIPPKPFNSWVLNETTCIWEAPTAYPDDDKRYYWDEDTTSWVAD